MRIAIVGLGLIGGSLAKSIKEKTSHEVFGADLDRETLMMARMCGAIDGELAPENLSACELVFLALRPGAAILWAEQHAEKIAKDAVLIDLCGVKRRPAAALAPLAATHGFTYLGGHPMAGKERGGFVNATSTLFDGASMILTPDESHSAQLLERMKAFFLDVGFASVTFSDPEEHDRIIAYTSQLAHITSSAYVKSPEAQRRRGFSAGSFRDMTRVARLDEDMWTELFLDDADFLTHEVDVLISHLCEYRDALAARDAETLRALLLDGKEKKSTAGGA